jgi:endonuclease YncB( thermonuclease family)
VLTYPPARHHAPESFRSRCEAELIAGLKARERLRQLVETNPIRVERHSDDRYGRTLAQVSAGGIDLAAQLLTKSYALPKKQPQCSA